MKNEFLLIGPLFNIKKVFHDDIPLGHEYHQIADDYRLRMLNVMKDIIALHLNNMEMGDMILANFDVMDFVKIHPDHYE